MATALTSADVKFSYERSYDPNAKVITKSVLNTIDRIETPDADHGRHRHEEAGSTAGSADRLLRGPDHAQGLLPEGRRRRVQRQADRQRSGEAQLLGEGRPDDPGRDQGLLGREDRRGPDHLPPPAGAGGARRRAPQGRGGHHHQDPAGPGGPGRQGAQHEDRGRAVRRPLLPVGGVAEAAPGQQAVPAGHEPGHRPRDRS